MIDTGRAGETKWCEVVGIRKRAGWAWICCLWGALAACLWIGSGAPVDGFERLESAAADGSILTTDLGHTHDPARVPDATPIEASESEEQSVEDGEVSHFAHGLELQGAQKRIAAAIRDDERALVRDPCTSQRNNRGPPNA